MMMVPTGHVNNCLIQPDGGNGRVSMLVYQVGYRGSIISEIIDLILIDLI